jgi:MOSC domain-containing protein
MPAGHIREIWRYPVKSMSGQRLDASEVGSNGLWGDRGWALRDDATGEIQTAKRHPILLACSAAYSEPPRPDRVPHVAIGLPDGDTVASDSPATSRRLSDLIGRRITLRQVQPRTDTAYYRRRERGSFLMARLWALSPFRRLLQRVAIHGPVAADLRATFVREPHEPLPDLSNLPSTAWEYYTPPGTYFDLFPIHLLTTSTLQLMSRLNPGARWDVRRFRPNVVVETGFATTTIEADWTGRLVRFGEVALKCEILTVRCAMTMHSQGELPKDPSVLRTIAREANQYLGAYASVANE